VVVGIVTAIACNGFLLPYRSSPYLALRDGTGRQLFTHRQARPMALAHCVVTRVAVCASVPAWRALGLLGARACLPLPTLTLPRPRRYAWRMRRSDGVGGAR
jgi:hypothetical protein